MEKTLGYLREILSNHLDENETSQTIYKKISKKDYQNKNAFIDDLDEKEMLYLNEMLPDEIQYAKSEQDEKRFQELNAIFQRLL